MTYSDTYLDEYLGDPSGADTEKWFYVEGGVERAQAVYSVESGGHLQPTTLSAELEVAPPPPPPDEEEPDEEEPPVDPPPGPTPGVPAGPPVNSSVWAIQGDTEFSNLNGWKVNNQTQDNDNSINLPKNVRPGSLGNGKGLTIDGIREAGYSRPFTSGEIEGHNAPWLVGNYFRAEVSGSFKDEQGIWPCLLWFRPENASDGEIDVMEWMGGMWSGDQKRVAITMHNEYGATQDSIKKPLLLKSNSWYDPNKPHTYTVEKVPGSIKVWVDGRLISTFTTADKGWWNRIMEQPNRRWYPRITLQIGAGSRNQVVPNPTASFLRTVMTVNRYRVWRYLGS